MAGIFCLPDEPDRGNEPQVVDAVLPGIPAVPKPGGCHRAPANPNENQRHSPPSNKKFSGRKKEDEEPEKPRGHSEEEPRKLRASPPARTQSRRDQTIRPRTPERPPARGGNCPRKVAGLRQGLADASHSRSEEEEQVLQIYLSVGIRSEYAPPMPVRATVLILAMFFTTRLNALDVGAPAPVITATDQDGKPVAFQDVYAKGITLVYFYPKADTPGCTAQACSLRDSFADLQGENLQILGVSRDTPDAQKKFREKYQLPFALIADKDGKVAMAFGVPRMMGLPISSRQSFLIKDGKIAWVSLQAKTRDHAGEVQAALDALKPR